jgi:hypothetical protein
MPINLRFPVAVSKPQPDGAAVTWPVRFEGDFQPGSIGFLKSTDMGYVANPPADLRNPNAFVARAIGVYYEKFPVVDQSTLQTNSIVSGKPIPFDIRLTQADLDAMMTLYPIPNAASVLQRAEEQGVLVAGSIPAGA